MSVLVTPQINKTLLEIHVPNFELIKKYYGQLGFEVQWE